MTKRIGILGGISTESTLRYYDRIIKGYYDRRQDCHYPEIVIFSLDFQRFTDAENSGDTDAYVSEIMTGITALEQAGAAFILMAANSPHAVFDQVEALAHVPLLSIVHVTAREGQRRELRTLLLLGIRVTMQGSFYQDACRARGIYVITPSDHEQDRIDAIIFEELTRGIFKDRSRAAILHIIGQHDVDGVILGCTELPLLLQQHHTHVPLLDTLALHAEAALDLALS